jgi:hypothetical protein
VSELAAEIEALRLLEGSWEGTGNGKFPTIDAFSYTETFQFYWNGIEPMLQFEQRTWVANDAEPRKDPLHWECGFLLALPAMGVEMTNAQNGERVEVMRGAIKRSASGLTMSLESTLLGNDDRLVRTKRRFECDGKSLRYRVWMATVRTPELTHHLEAELRRVV